jgi:hypothetical protein
MREAKFEERGPDCVEMVPTVIEFDVTPRAPALEAWVAWAAWVAALAESSAPPNPPTDTSVVNPMATATTELLRIPERSFVRIFSPIKQL